MPGITDEKVTAIRDLRSAGYSQRNVAEVLGTTKDTVSNYDPDDAEYDEDTEMEPDAIIDSLSNEVNPAAVVEDDYLPEGMTTDSGEQFAGAGPDETPFREQPSDSYRLTEDYASMSPGDFVIEFFNDFEIGTKKTFVKLMARRADRREKVPTREQMKDDLKAMSSGISKSNADYVAEEYWEEAQNYLEESEYGSYVEAPDGDSKDASSEGGWEGVSPNQQEGTWVTMPDGSRMYGQMVEQPDGSREFQPMTPPGQGGQGQFTQQQPAQQQNSGPSEEVKELRREIREMRESITSDSGGGMMEQIKKYKEMKQMLEQMGDEDRQRQQSGGNDALLQEIRQMRAQMQQDKQPATSEDPKEMILRRLSERDDVSPDQLSEFLDRMEGTSDPNVREKEIEKELREMELDQKRERAERVMSGLEKAMQSIGEGMANRFVQSGNSQQQGQQNAQQNAQQRPQTAQTATDGSGAVAPQAASMMGSSNDTRQCPACGQESGVDLTTAGFECDTCDFSIMPCPDCSKPIEIPPADELERGGCPDCGSQLLEPVEGEEITDCLECGWEGPYDEHSGDTVTCDSCGHETNVFAGSTEA